MKKNRGNLDIAFRKKDNGQTYLARQYYKLPLQVMPPHYQDDDGTAFLYLLNPSGGVLQNDRLESRIVVEKDARAFVTTPGNTKLYKMEDGYATIDNYFDIDSGGVLEYLPEHNVPFAQSTTYQNNEFRLKKDSVLIASDLVTAGRVSRGEVFEYNLYTSKTKIYVEDKLIAFDNTKIDPKIDSLSSLGILENFQSNGTLFIYKEDLPDNLISKIKEVCYDKLQVNLGASQINSSLIIVRFIGNSILAIQDVLFDIWTITRKLLLNKDSVRIRKY